MIVVAGRCRRHGARPGRHAGRLQCFTQELQQAQPGVLRVTTVVRQHQPDDEAFVVIGGSASKGGAFARSTRLVQPASRLVAALFELPRQALANLTRAALDLAPVAGLYQQPLGKTPIEAAQSRRVGLLDCGTDKLIEERHRVFEAYLRKVERLGRHGSMIKPIYQKISARGAAGGTGAPYWKATSAKLRSLRLCN